MVIFKQHSHKSANFGHNTFECSLWVPVFYRRSIRYKNWNTHTMEYPRASEMALLVWQSKAVVRKGLFWHWSNHLLNQFSDQNSLRLLFLLQLASGEGPFMKVVSLKCVPLSKVLTLDTLFSKILRQNMFLERLVGSKWRVTQTLKMFL